MRPNHYVKLPAASAAALRGSLGGAAAYTGRWAEKGGHSVPIKEVALLIFSLLLATFAHADQAEVDKYKNFTPKQIADMPEGQRSSEVPIMYTMAARKALSEGSELVFGMELNQLMYSGLCVQGQALRFT
jgi:hypothetical protein